jgi:predicted nucleic acid-binding protein
MSRTVVDASAAVALALGESPSAALVDAITAGGIVPALWPYEVANALDVGRRRGRVSAGQIDAVMELLASLDIEVAPTAVADVGTLARAAEQHGTTAYDAAYLVLALTQGLPLATLDRRLVQAARAAGAELIDPQE